MRTLRELAGWGLLFVVQLTPFAALLFLVAFFDDGEAWALLVALLLALLWPRMLLSARRLREPPEDEVAEADGRRPVVVVHRFTRAGVSLFSRMLLGQPGLFRDFRDARRERALARAVIGVGPILSLARPAPPPVHGPVRLESDDGFRVSLDRALRRASLAVIVLDGGETNALEVERAAALLGLTRTMLVVPPELTAPAYERLRERLPLLPAYDPRARAIRFGANDQPFFLRDPAVSSTELVPQPKAPAASWLLAGLAVLGGLVSAIATPALLEDDVHGSNDTFAVGSLTVIVLAIVMAGLSRRAVRLVPANEAVMVTVAAFPWLVMELGSWVASSSEQSRHAFRNTLEVTAVAAAYSAPLLVTAAIILAAASLIRRSNGRRGAFATFGAAALLPFWPLALSISDAGADSSPLIAGMLAGALTLGLSAWNASGEPGRANAPLPIGAAVAGALSIGAAAAVTSHLDYAQLIYDGVASGREDARVPALALLSAAWPWFLLAGPAVVVLVSMQFSGRATRVAVASAAAFAPLVLLVSLASSAEARARAHVEGRGFDLASATGGATLAPDFELPALTTYSCDEMYGPPELVVDRTGVYAGGERVSSLEELAYAGAGTPPRLSRALYALAAADGGNRAWVGPRVAASRQMDVALLSRVVRAAQRAGFGEVRLIARRPDQQPCEVALATRPPIDTPERCCVLFVTADAGSIVLTGRDGTRIPSGSVDEGWLRERLRERRAQDPNRDEINLAVRSYMGGTQTVAQLAAILHESFSQVALVDGPPAVY